VNKLRIAVGSDHRGFTVRAKLIDLLRKLGHEVDDVGAFSSDAVDYPDIAALVAEKISHQEADRGILICGTGLGMCIAANKFAGVRAAPCHDDLTAEMSRRHNDANILCLSADLLGERILDRMIETWLGTPFEGGRHARRLEKITSLERKLEAENRLGKFPP
jgi:ribose 5-phosphate isomerase B